MNLFLRKDFKVDCVLYYIQRFSGNDMLYHVQLNIYHI